MLTRHQTVHRTIHWPCTEQHIK